MTPTKPKYIMLLSSRKFWACVIGIIFVLVKAYYPNFPLEEEQVITIVVLLVSFIFGVAIEDGLARKGY